MTTPELTSIIIPTFNHGHYVLEAIDSAIAQRAARVEVIVVDDGSTDDTRAIVADYVARGGFAPDLVRYIPSPHAGPCSARNIGIAAARGEFLMFLDADDVIDQDKVATQLKAFTEDVGWVLCDVRIEDEAKSKTENASVKYDYAGKDLGGWVQERLGDANFIPVHSPLIRRSILETPSMRWNSIRFRPEAVPEDWLFWREVAGAARVRYVPEVLATYRHRKSGRSRTKSTADLIPPQFEAPLRLNLGCGAPGADSWHPMPGFVNLDKSMGWHFEDGLATYANGSVAGITISHALMYVNIDDWPAVFAEFARVLAPGGVLRITEDNTRDPKSSRVGGWMGSQPAITLTWPALVRDFMESAGLVVHDVTAAETLYRDASLCQAQHGKVPDVFFIEGVRETAVLFSPHNDDETLFAAFTIQKHHPHVVVCFPSSGDYGDPEVRTTESRRAVTHLGGAGVQQWQGGDLVEKMKALDGAMRPPRVFAPHPRASHPDHVAVAAAAAQVFGDRLTTYHTYKGPKKVRGSKEVEFEPTHLKRKLEALALYESQITHARAFDFFTWDMLEYYGSGAE